MNKTLLIIIGLAAVLIAGYYTFVMGSDSNQENQPNMAQETDSEEQMQELSQEKRMEMIQNNQYVLTADLLDVRGDGGTGTAYILRTNKLEHMIEADLPDPQGENKYEGWLVNQSPLSFISTGVMEKNDDGMWILEFESAELHSDKNFVVITEETVIDETPEEHVIEALAQ